MLHRPMSSLQVPAGGNDWKHFCTGTLVEPMFSSDGTQIEGKSYLPGDLWATVAHALRIPLSTVHTSKRGRSGPPADAGIRPNRSRAMKRKYVRSE